MLQTCLSYTLITARNTWTNRPSDRVSEGLSD